MFATWEGFKERITQIYGDPKEEATVERKLQVLAQKGSVIDYTTTFQQLATIVKWNNKALIARYRKGLKAKVQDALILKDNLDNLRELIN